MSSNPDLFQRFASKMEPDPGALYGLTITKGGPWRQAMPNHDSIHTVAPHLPYLRRFARALTGTQASGDTYVAAVLESLIADPSFSPGAANPQDRALPVRCAGSGGPFP